MRSGTQKLGWLLLTFTLLMTGCASDKVKNQAMEAAAHYWQDKAYPGKAYDVQVTEAQKTSDGQYRVKGIVDGETRVGTFNPDSEIFSEGYYSLAHERSARIAELEQEAKYWKDKAQDYEQQIYKLKVQIAALKDGVKFNDDGATTTKPATAPASVQQNN